MLNTFSLLRREIGVIICREWLVQDYFLEYVRKGAKLICHPANSGNKKSLETLRQLSKENKVYSITANRTGSEINRNKVQYIGTSQVIDPEGKILAQGSPDKGEVKSVNIRL